MINALLWIAAFFCTLPIIQPYELGRLGAVIFFVLAAAPFAARGNFNRGPLIIATLLFWGWCVASIFWSISPVDSIIVLLAFSTFPAALVFFGPQTPEKFFKTCLVAATGLLGAYATFIIFQYFFDRTWFAGGDGFLQFADINSLSALFSLGFFCSLGFLVAENKKKFKILAALGCAALLSGMEVLGGRAALFCLLAAFTLFVFFEYKRVARHGIFFILIGVAALAVFKLSFIFTRTSIAPLYRVALANTWEGAGHRMPIWGGALALAQDHWLNGTGFGTFAYFYPQYRLLADTVSSGAVAHCDPLQLLTETGLPGMVLFYTVLIVAGLRLIRYFRNASEQDENRPLALALFAGLAAMLAHTHVNYNLYVVPTTMFAGLILAWWYKLTTLSPVPAASPSPSRVASTVLIAATIIACATSTILSEYNITRAREVIYTGNVDAFARYVERANKVSLGFNPRPYVLAAAVPLSLLYKEKDTLSAPEKEKLVKQIQYLLDQARKNNPRTTAAVYDEALLYRAVGDEQKRDEALNKALAINPQHFPSRLMLAQIYVDKNDYAHALEILKAGYPWWRLSQHTMIPYYQLMIECAAAVGDKVTLTEIQSVMHDKSRIGNRSLDSVFIPDL